MHQQQKTGAFPRPSVEEYPRSQPRGRTISMHGTFSRSLVQPTTHLKKTLVKLDHFPTHGGEHTQKYLKPAPIVLKWWLNIFLYPTALYITVNLWLTGEAAFTCPATLTMQLAGPEHFFQKNLEHFQDHFLGPCPRDNSSNALINLLCYAVTRKNHQLDGKRAN